MMLDLSTMPKLGFGTMRLPQKEGAIDHEQVCAMVDACLARGMNYFDTAYRYHDGESEPAVRRALVERHPRESYYLATKLPAWMMEGPQDKDRIFEDQLRRCGVEYFDFYLLHSVEDANVQKYEAYDCFAWGAQQKKAGRIRHFGFSFHGTPALLRRLLDDHPEVEFVQIQLNYMDWDNPRVCSGELYEILHERGVPIVVMEPVKGGNLASLRPQEQAILERARPGASAASWALRFAAGLDGVMTVLSGMSTIGQVQENLDTFAALAPLAEDERAALAEVVRAVQALPVTGCTGCSYCCEGCPQNIPIPIALRAMDEMRQYPGNASAPRLYGLRTKDRGVAADCIACGQCESVCPQHLPIIELLREASALLDA